MPQWFRGWRIGLGAIVLVILAGAWHVVSPAQAMVKSCQTAMAERLLARVGERKHPFILVWDVFFPSLIQHTANTYVFDSSTTVIVGNSSTASWEDTNGREIHTDYTYRCIVQYTGYPFWGDIQEAHVIEIRFLSEQVTKSIVRDL